MWIELQKVGTREPDVGEIAPQGNIVGRPGGNIFDSIDVHIVHAQAKIFRHIPGGGKVGCQRPVAYQLVIRNPVEGNSHGFKGEGRIGPNPERKFVGLVQFGSPP